MQAKILQACEAPSDPQRNNKVEELGRQSPLHLEKATQTLGVSELSERAAKWAQSPVLGTLPKFVDG
jgi:hypothetical protein